VLGPAADADALRWEPALRAALPTQQLKNMLDFSN
jgi:hypothetical protein